MPLFKPVFNLTHHSIAIPINAKMADDRAYLGGRPNAGMRRAALAAPDLNPS
jgi:hypothetical protein